MKTLNITTAKIFSLLALLFITSDISADDIELRFATAHVDNQSQELYVDIQVKYAQKGQLILAGQNYRFYYDSEVLSLDVDATDSKLSSDSYGAITFEDHLSGIEADHVNQLDFDDNLGFANFSINLSDNVNGGLTLTEGSDWVSVATLKFDIIKAGAAYDVVWGREGMSDLYATAFVEVARWVSPIKLDIVNISYYGDLSAEKASEEISAPTVAVGPNPTSDYVTITFEEEVKSTTSVTFRDLSGKEVKNSRLSAGAVSTKVDLSDLTPATYFVEVVERGTGLVHNTQVIVAK